LPQSSTVGVGVPVGDVVGVAVRVALGVAVRVAVAPGRAWSSPCGSA
jgi:hypothetical protein